MTMVPPVRTGGTITSSGCDPANTPMLGSRCCCAASPSIDSAVSGTTAERRIPVTDIQWGNFIREYLRHPLRTAAILPSSSSVAREMAAVPAHGDPVVVELGPGTGAFTGE